MVDPGAGSGVPICREFPIPKEGSTVFLDHRRARYDIRAKFSSMPIYLAMKRQPCWRFEGTQRKFVERLGGNMKRATGFRLDVKTYMFRFVPGVLHGKARSAANAVPTPLA